MNEYDLTGEQVSATLISFAITAASMHYIIQQGNAANVNVETGLILAGLIAVCCLVGVATECCSKDISGMSGAFCAGRLLFGGLAIGLGATAGGMAIADATSLPGGIVLGLIMGMVLAVLTWNQDKILEQVGKGVAGAIKGESSISDMAH